MAIPLGTPAAISVASGVMAYATTIPTGANTIAFRVEGATCRFSDSASPNASMGLLIAPADAPIRMSNPSTFRLYPLAAAQVNVLFYATDPTFSL